MFIKERITYIIIIICKIEIQYVFQFSFKMPVIYNYNSFFLSESTFIAEYSSILKPCTPLNRKKHNFLVMRK